VPVSTGPRRNCPADAIVGLALRQGEIGQHAQVAQSTEAIVTLQSGRPRSPLLACHSRSREPRPFIRVVTLRSTTLLCVRTQSRYSRASFCTSLRLEPAVNECAGTGNSQTIRTQADLGGIAVILVCQFYGDRWRPVWHEGGKRTQRQGIMLLIDGD
jgi:hypothetical protein